MLVPSTPIQSTPPLQSVSRRPRTILDFNEIVDKISLSIISGFSSVKNDVQCFRSLPPSKKRTAIEFAVKNLIDGLERVFGEPLIWSALDWVMKLAYSGALAIGLLFICGTDRDILQRHLKFVVHRHSITSIGYPLQWNVPWVMDRLNRLYSVYFACSDKWTAFLSAYQHSPPFTGNTPAEAIRQHQAEVAQGKWICPPGPRKVRLQFFADVKSVLNSAGERPTPDFRIDLTVDANSGVDLSIARKKLGVERLAVITDYAPFRTIFDPASPDRLSTVAAYDLSHQFTRPIKVFEPSESVSVFTSVKRSAYEPVCRTAKFTFICLRASLGLPISRHSSAYNAVAFGETCAARLDGISRRMAPGNAWAREAFFVILQFLACIVVLPTLCTYQLSVGIRWFMQKIYVALLIVTWVIFALLATISVIAVELITMTSRTVYSLAFAMSGRGWVLTFGTAWFLTADYYATIS